MQIYFGIVENRSDPLELGRCQVRVVGLHTHDKNLLPTSDLPWCATMQPTISAAMNGIGHTPIGPVEGTSVVVTYLDDSMQQGLVMGAVGGIATEPVPIDYDDSGPILENNTVKEVSLRSVKGPISGNKLTFQDPNSGRTDLTSKLTANMRVFGFGIEDGTTIVSIDSGTQITISTTVRDFGENIVEFKPPATNAAAIIESKAVTSTAVTVTEKADTVKNIPANNAIPTIPPPEFKSSQTKVSEGIKALIAACDKVGLTTREQKCALLAIAGGESGWTPIEESHQYSSPAALKQLFSFLTDAEADALSNAKKKGLSKAEFFSVIYGPTKRGKNFLGHKTDAEGGIYFGRGFIQLTGKANYERYSKLGKTVGLDVDIVKNPELLIDDINVSALISALYLKDRVAKGVNPNASPAYFIAAKDSVGVNIPRVAAAKQKYYDYFYGVEATGSSSKDAGATPPIDTAVDGSEHPGPSDKSITSGSFGIGFRDPNNKYPLKDYIGESDVNRLARGIINGTVVTDKDAKRKLNIPKAGGNGEWSQPEAPFGAKYPFNKVFESEGGHVQEFDDTPGQERTHLYHRSGTFTEVDANGTQVNYIVGDNFILMEHNGCIHVAGECNITVDGNTNIFARSDANIDVAANATVTVGNNLAIGSANDTTLAVGGDLQIKALGDISMEGANIYNKTAGTHNVQADGSINIKAATVNQEASGDINIKGAGVKQSSSGTMDIKAAGALNVDYATYNLGTGAAAEAGAAADSIPVELTPPPAGDPLYSNLPYFIPPERQFESNSPIETPEDWDTPEGRAVAANDIRTGGIAGAAVAVADEGSEVMSGGGNSKSVDTALILTTKDFTNDYRISKNFSLGMLIDGGVNGKHRLQAQMLRANKDSAERLYTVQEIVSNLAHSAANILEPALAVLPGGLSGYNRLWKINSGYRLKGVVPHESPNSDHCKGHCFDIGLIDPDKYNKSFEIIKAIEAVIVYDQLILEYSAPQSVWIHAGYRPNNNRKQAFTMVNHSTYKRNSNGIPAGFFLLNTIPPNGK